MSHERLIWRCKARKAVAWQLAGVEDHLSHSDVCRQIAVAVSELDRPRDRRKRRHDEEKDVCNGWGEVTLHAANVDVVVSFALLWKFLSRNGFVTMKGALHCLLHFRRVFCSLAPGCCHTNRRGA